MAIRSNRAYNNPEIGAAMNNIASMFAPPDSGELVNYAQAAGLRQKQGIIEQLKSDPRYSGADAGVLADLFDPTGSWAAQDQNTATARRGQDITAQTSIANNTLDNRTKLALPRFSPLAPGEVLPPVQGSLASQFGLPTDLGAVAGAPKPLSETEVKGGELLRLIGEGDITDDMQVQDFTGSNTPVKIVGPDGKPTYASPGAALGQQAFVNEGAQAKPENGIAVLPDGRRVTAVQAEGGAWLNAQTGAPLPADIQVFKLPQAQGSAAEVGLGPTTANQTAANNQRAEVTRALGLLDLYEGVVRNDPASVGLAGSIKGLAQNAIAVTQDLASSFGTTVPELQKFSGELRDGLSAVAPEMFDASIPEAEFYQGALAYALARTENPSGEVSRQAYERAYDRVTGGALKNSQSAAAAIGAFRQMLNTQLAGIKALDDPSEARTDTGYGGATAAPGVPEGWSAEEWGVLTEDERQQVLNDQ